MNYARYNLLDKWLIFQRIKETVNVISSDQGVLKGTDVNRSGGGGLGG